MGQPLFFSKTLVLGLSLSKMPRDVDKQIVQKKAYQITNTKTYVFSDSVLCVGKLGDDPFAIWKSKIKWYSENNHVKDNADGVPSGKYYQKSQRWASSRNFKNC